MPDRPDPIRVLFVEDAAFEMDLALNQLKRAGLSCIPQRVETEEALRAAVLEFEPTVILSDFTLPQFDGMTALRVAREMAPQVPFIFVSGTIGEERAIEALLCGAVDYVLKGNLARLPPAVRRALDDAVARRDRERQQAHIVRLDRVLRMLSGINALVVRIRDRTELLREACRLSVSVGGYAAAIIALKPLGATAMQPVAWNGVNESLTASLREGVADAITRPSSFISKVVRSGAPFVCNAPEDLEATVNFNTLMSKAGMCSLVALPLVIDGTAVGVLLLVARDPGAISEEELRMLREVSGNLSFALQYMQQDTKVRFLSHFDPHTGLAKRSLFCDRLSRMLSHPVGRRLRHAVAVFDIERLSLINDSFGRRMGDLLLQHVADRLKRRFPQTDRLAHFGGGTFAVATDTPVQSTDEMLAVAREHATALFGEPFVIEQREIPVSVRSGFALFPDHGRDADNLVQNAEAALHTARASGERQLHYSAEKHSEMVARLALEHKLRLALERRQFELHYQAKVNVMTRRIQGVEALMRWRDPDSGLVSPAAFLPLLESTGLIVDVGDWAIQQAAEDCQRWLQQGIAVRVAVNIAPMQLQLPEFATSLVRVLRGWATTAAGLDIEITEGALNENSVAEVKKLRMLRNLGVKVAIDDFGTGYSSLSRMSALPIDILKIDRSFVAPLPKDPSARVLVTTIVSLARAFGLTTVAEGVETQEQLDLLWQLGCDQSQGYLHSKPVDAVEFLDLLRHGRGNLILPPAPPGAEDQASAQRA